MIEGVFLVLLFFKMPVAAVGPVSAADCLAAGQSSVEAIRAFYEDDARAGKMPLFRGRRVSAADVTLKCLPERPVIEVSQ